MDNFTDDELKFILLSCSVDLITLKIRPGATMADPEIAAGQTAVEKLLAISEAREGASGS